MCAHNVLNSHAKVVELYRTKYSHYNGKIGIVLNMDYAEPLTDSDADKGVHSVFQLAILFLFFCLLQNIHL